MAGTIKGIPQKFKILGIGISAIDMADACRIVGDAISKKEKMYVSVCPVGTIMECGRNRKAFESVNSADLVTPDGMPTVWIGRAMGHKNLRRVYGPELMQNLCAISADRGYKNYLYGSSPHVVNKLMKNLSKNYPGIRICGAYSPPFRDMSDEENCRTIRSINDSKSDIVWVALGSPKQDIWMHEHRDLIDAPVMIGVGAAFDFLAGTKPQAPRWIRNNGFEWLFRFATEPKRLWRRYLVDNSLFVFYILRDMIYGIHSGSRKKKI